MKKKRALIIGAGPAGLTAAYELATKTNIQPIIFEATRALGGISQTVEYKGNRIDIGGHRFFSKSDRVMRWWCTLMPLEGTKDIAQEEERFIHGLPHRGDGPDPTREDQVFLIRARQSHIFFLRKFFPYPLSLSMTTLLNLGTLRVCHIGMSYLYRKLFPIRPEKSLEDFMINRFGQKLYEIFFKDYTEKVWGVSSREILPEWGAQRIKGLSITKALLHALKKPFTKKSLAQKRIETSLIEYFLYPKLGPGQLWETCAKRIEEAGGAICRNHEVVGICADGSRITGVRVRDTQTGSIEHLSGDFVLSSMPVKDLIKSFEGISVPRSVREVAAGLQYRDFIMVGLLVKKNSGDTTHNQSSLFNRRDNWLYIQEKEVKMGRLQIFNNWSPYLVHDPELLWIGLEYFCNVGDELWSMSDEEMQAFAINELVSLGMIEKKAVCDRTIVRMEKTYPAYFGTYPRFSEIQAFTDQFTNLFLIGRNGMHRYNNQDHSMLTAMTAVEALAQGNASKDAIWAVNTEQEYHEDMEK